MATISFGGLASGLDTKQIVQQLVEIKAKQLITPLTQRITKLKGQKLSLDPLQGLYDDVKSTANVLRSSTAFDIKGATSSSTTVAKISSVDSSDAISGTYDLTAIGQLAQPDRIIFDGETDTTTSQFGTGTFTITYKGTATSVAITSSNNTLQGIVNAINDANAGVTAAIINDGSATTPYRLTLTANASGSDTRITHTITSVLTGLAVDATSSATTANEPQDATFKINGVSMSSKNNTVTDAIAGVTFDLLTTDTTNTITLKVKQDTAGLVSKISSFVTAYEKLQAGLKLTVTADPATGNFGPLGRDPSFSSSKIRLQQIMGKQYVSFAGYNFKNLAQIGIAANASGALKVDSSILTDALETSVQSVKLLFQGSSSEDGVAEKMVDYIGTMTQAGGVFDDKQQNIDTAMKRIEKLAMERQKTVESYQSRLQDQYNRLEKVINQLKARESQINSFAGTYSSSSNRLL